MKKLIFLAVLAVGVTGCSVEDQETNKFQEMNLEVVELDTLEDVAPEESTCGQSVIWPFGVEEHGYVEAKIDGDYLSVQIFAGPGKTYNQSRVEVATEVSYFPLKGGALPPGQIQERDHFSNAPYLFPLELFGTDCEIFIAAWAIITPGGSDADHWAGDLEFVAGNPNRGLYFSYCFECETPEPGDVCESAYGYSPNPGETLVNFYRERITNQNWGWYNYVDIDDANGSETIKIYAAAGRNDIKNGTHVGNVIVNYDGTTTFEAFNGFSFSNTHIYIGETMPSKRLAPGHFEANSSAVSNGDFYLIVHLEVCADAESW